MSNTKSRQRDREPGRPPSETEPKTLLAGRLQQLCGGFNISRGCEIFGVKRTAARDYLIGDRAPAYETLRRIVEQTGCSAGWLLTGDRGADQGISPDVANVLRRVLAEADNTCDLVRELLGGIVPGAAAIGHGPGRRMIPILGAIAAGPMAAWSDLTWLSSPTEADERVAAYLSRGRRQSSQTGTTDAEDGASVALVQYSAPDAEGLVEFLDAPGVLGAYPDAVAWRVVGDSMAPRYVEGDVLIISPSCPAEPGAPCVARLKDSVGPTVKLYTPTGRRIHLQPVNTAERPLTLKASDLAWAFRVLWRVRLDQ